MRKIPRLELEPLFAEQLPELRQPALKAKSQKYAAYRQKALTDLLRTSYERRWPHDAVPQATSFSRDYLVKKLRVGRDRYKEFIEPFWTWTDESPSRLRYLGQTRAYRLKDQVASRLSEVYQSDALVSFNWATLGNGEVEEAEEGRPKNGIPAPLSEDLYVPPILNITVGHIDRAISRIECWIRRVERAAAPLEEGKTTTLRDALRCLQGLRIECRGIGGIPNFYKLQSHGRLGPVPGTSHLIPLPNLLRRLLYEGSGMHDFDIRSCHWSILRSLARAHDVETRKIDHYMAHKEDYHSFWAEKSGHASPGDFKRITLSWLNGGRLSPYSDTLQELGEDVVEFLTKNGAAKGLHSEVRSVLTTVLEGEADIRTVEGHKVLRNAAGAHIPISDGGLLTELACHFMTGYEQYAMRLACRQVERLQAIIFDGFIAPPQETEPLEDLIRDQSEKELGFPLDVEFKVSNLSEPVPIPDHLKTRRSRGWFVPRSELR